MDVEDLGGWTKGDEERGLRLGVDLVHAWS
jgi:hypothetical protein